MNTLKAVFWDYPELTSLSKLKTLVISHKAQLRVYRWLMRRFLENGRGVDAFSYFTPQEIAAHLPGLGLSL